MRIIDVAFNNYERFNMTYLTDLRDDHVNDCLRVAQTVALESAPPLPLIKLKHGREGRAPARPRRHLSPHVNDIFLRDDHVNDCLRVAQTVALESAPPSPPHNFMDPSLDNCAISFR